MKTVVVRNIKRADAELVKRLGALGTATVHEAYGRFGLMKPYLRPVWAYGMHTSPTALLRRVPFSESMMLRRHSGAEMEGSLGRFGDRRLEKGGPACWLGWFVW